MNKQILGAGVLVLGLIVVWWYYGQTQALAPDTTMTNTNDEMASETNDVNRVTGETIPLAGKGSFAQLMGLNKRLTCEVVYSDQNQSVASTVYIDGTNMRTDSEMQMADDTVSSHMISDGETVYSWSDSSAGMVAMKYKIDNSPVGEGEQMDAGSRSFDLNQSVDYKCRPWSGDASMFVPPSDITFTDLSEMMQNYQTGSFDPNLIVQ